MKTGVKFLEWRNGKPRWRAQQLAKKKGIKGKDLKYDDGRYMKLNDARIAAHKLNVEHGIASQIHELPSEIWQEVIEQRIVRTGYVYFCILSDQVKIGFSTSPLRRMHSMTTSLPEPVTISLSVPGTLQDEAMLHELLADNHIKGEWFFASQRVMNIMLRSLKYRRVMTDIEPLNL